MSFKREVVKQKISEILTDLYSPHFFAKTRHVYKILRPYNEYFEFSKNLLLGFVNIYEISLIVDQFNDDIVSRCFEYGSNAYKLPELIHCIRILRNAQDAEAEKVVFINELKKYNIHHKSLNTCSMAWLLTQVRELPFTCQVELYDIIHQLLD